LSTAVAIVEASGSGQQVEVAERTVAAALTLLLAQPMSVAQTQRPALPVHEDGDVHVPLDAAGPNRSVVVHHSWRKILLRWMVLLIINNYFNYISYLISVLHCQSSKIRNNECGQNEKSCEVFFGHFCLNLVKWVLFLKNGIKWKLKIYSFASTLLLNHAH
jgi:hypothetical protein